jgi:xanthine/CO dehydrogenase XdhC/CoxF family maturation factor
VSVFDGRAHYAPEGKFHREIQVTVGPVGQTIRSLAIDAWTVAVLMSHSYSQDLQALKAFREAWPRYLGILGPRRRTDQLIVDSGLSANSLSREICSPIGLDLGADGPEQVALAISAEISAVLKGRSAGFLRDRSGPIHERREMAEYAEVWTGSAVCR